MRHVRQTVAHPHSCRHTHGDKMAEAVVATSDNCNACKPERAETETCIVHAICTNVCDGKGRGKRGWGIVWPGTTTVMHCVCQGVVIVKSIYLWPLGSSCTPKVQHPFSSYRWSSEPRLMPKCL